MNMNEHRNAQILDTIVQCSPLAIICIDTDGKVFLWNQAAEKIFGWRSQEVLGRQNPIVPEDKVNEFHSLFEEVRSGQAYVSQELVRQRKDGSRIMLNVSSAPLCDEAGSTVGLMAIFEDISTRKEADENLQVSEERFQLAMRGASDGLWDWDLSTDEVYYSPRWKSMLGYTSDELEHSLDTWKNLVHPDDKDRTLGVVQSLLDGKTDKFEVEFRMRHKDGTYRHILSRAFLTEAVEGKARRLVGTHVDITGRKRSEEKLSHMHKLMDYVISHAQSAIAVHDKEMKYIYVSDQYLKQYKVEEKDVIGRHHYDVFPDLPQKWRDVHKRVLAGAVEGKDEDPYFREDGGVDWTRWECRPWYEEDGSVGGLIVYTEVITERMRREEQLRRSEAQLRESQEVAKIGSWVTDLSSNTLYWSDETYRRFDKDPATFTPTPEYFFNRIFPEDREGVLKAIEESLANDTPYHIQASIRNESGREWVVEGFGRVERDGEGKPLRFVGTAQDITERRHAEDKMKRSEEFVRNMLDTVDEGFIVVDRDYRIQTANRAYCQREAAGTEVIGRHCYEISHKSRTPCFEMGEDCAVQKVFESGKPHTALHRHSDPGGEKLYVETKAFPVKDEAGNVVSAIETINDITERHLLEEERLKAQKLESIGTLAGGIAHDFNNLLQGVFGHISLARATLERKSDSWTILKEAEGALRQTVGLTNQLLTFAKGGKPVVKTVPVLPILESAARFSLSGSSSSYRILSEGELWKLNADEAQIGQVLQNIILNADQSMPQGGEVIIVACNVPKGDNLPPALGKGDYLAISVKDMGSGIPQENIEKIFDPYFTTKKSGSGLGLATSYSIIRQHDGFIAVDTRKGEGSTFTVYLPAVRKLVERETPRTLPESGALLRVLVMDDEETIRRVTGKMITSMGHECETAESGETALVIFEDALREDRPFDIVILDLTVRGGMGGGEAISKLLAMDPKVKAIMSSGYSNDKEHADYISLGFKAFLKKPYSLDELKATISLVM